MTTNLPPDSLLPRREGTGRRAGRSHLGGRSGAGFSVSDMLDQNIYPVTEEENEDEFFDYVWSYLSDMKDFFDDAAAEGQAVIFYMP